MITNRVRVRRLVLWAIIIALLSSPFILSIVQRQGTEGKKPSPTQLMARAAMYANESLYLLNNTLLLSRPNTSSLLIDAQGARNVSAALVNEAANTPVTGFAGFIRRSMLSYAKLANASAPAMLAAPQLYEGLIKAEKALQALKACRVDDYIVSYRAARAHLLNAERNLLEALSILLNINTSYLLSPIHEDIAQNLSITVARAVAAINELENLYKVVTTHSDVIRTLCSGNRASKQKLPPLINALNKLHPERAGPLGYDEAEVITKLMSLIQGNGQCNQQGSGGGNGPSSQGKGGTGAGYRKPSSDD